MRFITLMFFIYLSGQAAAQQVNDTAKNRFESDTPKAFLPKVSLKVNPVILQEVTIKGMRNYRLDSLKLRKEFASVFAYKGPKFKDIFITKPVHADTRYSPFQNSTSSLVSVNLLSAIGLIGKNKTPVSKLQKRLLREEESNYVDHAFSIQKVQSLTSLKGDSLQKFMNKYRPSGERIKQMTEYQLMLYIKKSYGEYIK